MIEFFTYFSFAQMITCALFLLPHRKQNVAIIFYILLMLSGASYLLGDLVVNRQDSLFIWWIGSAGGNALPGLFWLVSLSVFGHNIRIKPWQYGLASFSFIVNMIFQVTVSLTEASLADASIPLLLMPVIKYSLLFIELALVLHALMTAIKYWRDDLVQERRYIRGGVITISGECFLPYIIIEQLLNIGSFTVSLMKVASLALLVTGINYLLFSIRPSTLFQTKQGLNQYPFNQPLTNCSMLKETSVNKTDDSLTDTYSHEQKHLKRVIELMEVEHFYQQDDATIANLAKQVPMQEYKLRQLINGEMNFRNFNDFLNFYRIKEISQKLEHKALNHIPVLTFALESGFRSLSTFNKAFKETHGVSPTQYRKSIKTPD